jgi:hypothetical protein
MWSETKSTITEAITGLLYQPLMMMGVEQSVECLAGETEVLEGLFTILATFVKQFF